MLTGTEPSQLHRRSLGQMQELSRLSPQRFEEVAGSSTMKVQLSHVAVPGCPHDVCIILAALGAGCSRIP